MVAVVVASAGLLDLYMLFLIDLIPFYTPSPPPPYIYTGDGCILESLCLSVRLSVVLSVCLIVSA